MKPTESDDLLRITPRQETAIEMLLSGKNDAAAAVAIGVHRTTIARWRAFHPGFQAELARRRGEMFGTAAERLRALVPKALDVLESELVGENKISAAQTVLRMAGLNKLSPPQLEPDNANGILSKQVKNRLTEKQTERERRMNADELLMARVFPPNYAEQLLQEGEALDEVKEELRGKLSDIQFSDNECDRCPM